MKARLPLIVLLAAVALVTTSSASADTQYVSATSGTLSMSSPAWEYIGQGRDWSFTTPAYEFLTIGDPCACFVGIRAENFNTAQPADFQWSFLYFQVPAGETMTSGTTYTTHRWPFQQASEAGLDVGITGRGCNESRGEFTVLDAAFAPNGDVRHFHATFKQYCELGSVPLEGEIDVVKVPPPLQTAEVSIDANGSVTRTTNQAIVRGTVRCTVPGPAKLSGTVTQGKASGKFDEIFVDCSDSDAAWSAAVSSTTGHAFSAGSAAVKAEAEATDPNYSDADGVALVAKSERTATVTLSR